MASERVLDMSVHIAIHHRPLGAVLAFSREMGRRLDGLIEPGHFAAADHRGTTGRTT